MPPTLQDNPLLETQPGDLPWPVAIISDLHLDHRADFAARIEGLTSIWDHAASVVFNGDTVNWVTARDENHAAAAFDALADALTRAGKIGLVLCGNTDPGLPTARYHTLYDGRMMIFHGDVLFPRLSPWRPSPNDLGELHRRQLDLLSPERRDTLDGRTWAACQSWLLARSNQSQPHDPPLRTMRSVLAENIPAIPGRFLRTILAWRRTPRLGEEFCRLCCPAAEIVVNGHTHWGGCWQRNALTVVNTGSVLGPGPARIVTARPDRVEVHRMDRRRRRQGKLLRTITINA